MRHQAIYVLPQRISFIWDVTIYRTDLKSGTAQFCVWQLPLGGKRIGLIERLA